MSRDFRKLFSATYPEFSKLLRRGGFSRGYIQLVYHQSQLASVKTTAGFLRPKAGWHRLGQEEDDNCHEDQYQVDDLLSANGFAKALATWFEENFEPKDYGIVKLKVRCYCVCGSNYDRPRACPKPRTERIGQAI